MLDPPLLTTGVFNGDGVAALDPDLLATGEIYYQHLTCQNGDSGIKQKSHIKTSRNTTAKRPMALTVTRVLKTVHLLLIRRAHIRISTGLSSSIYILFYILK